MYIGIVLKNQNFTKFQELIQKAGLEDEVNSLQNVTVFAPTNKAFETPEATKILEDFSSDPEKSKAFIRYHFAEGQIMAEDMNNNGLLETKGNGNKIRLNLYSTVSLINTVFNS